MDDILIAWAISAVVIVLLTGVLGRTMTPPRGPLGVLIDGRGRYSLTHFQIVVWSLVIVSLIERDSLGRPAERSRGTARVPDPRRGARCARDQRRVGGHRQRGQGEQGRDADTRKRIAASGPGDPPRLAQMFWLEEGDYADRVVDVTKFQNFVITITLVVAYVALAIDGIQSLTEVEKATLPTFPATFLILLGISHGAYIAAKVPTQAGEAPGLNMDNRGAVADHVAATREPPERFRPATSRSGRPGERRGAPNPSERAPSWSTCACCTPPTGISDAPSTARTCWAPRQRSSTSSSRPRASSGSTGS